MLRNWVAALREQDRLADADALGLEAVHFEQHAEASTVTVDRAKRRLRDERQLPADQVAERVGPRTLDDVTAHPTTVDCDHGRASAHKHRLRGFRRAGG